MAELTLRNARKSYGAVEVLKGVDLNVNDRESWFLSLRMIAGLEKITSGELLIDGVRTNAVDTSERGLAMVCQSYALLPT